MMQTFDDLCREGNSYIFMQWLLAETLFAAARENMLSINSRNIMKNITAPPTAALISFVLVLPLGLMFLIFLSEIEPLITGTKYFLTTDGQQVNMLGRVIMLGGMLALPVAFVWNLIPVVRTARLEGKLFVHTANLMLVVAILLLIAATWGGLALETVSCGMGISCD
ncbi:MAG TPA: hypothetical protein VGO50_21170 [Pyrinomonadaceae bacterium]|nr:hypothetical protein [Pyrinomonadaceae bacterium]